jgi:hypothetical protein
MGRLAQVPTAAESCALERQVVGGSRSVRRALVSPLILLLRPNHTSPHAHHMAAIRYAHIGHDVNIVPLALGSSCDALTCASVRVVPLFSLQRMPGRDGVCCVGKWGWTNAGRGGDGRGVAHPSRALGRVVYGGCIRLQMRLHRASARSRRGPEAASTTASSERRRRR